MRKIVIKLILTMIMTLTPALPVFPVPQDQDEIGEVIVALVNGNSLTHYFLDEELARIMQNIEDIGMTLDDSQLLFVKEQAMENIIGFELLYQESLKSGIEISEDQIDEQWEKVKEQFSDEDELQEALKEKNISETILRNQFERTLAIQQFVDVNFTQKITVSDAELKAYYDNNQDIFTQPEMVRASHILIGFDADADESQKELSREEIEKIQKRIKNGEDFAALARESSHCPSSAQGGDLGYVSRGQIPQKSFEDAAFALNPGDISDIVETKFGYHIIKVADKKEEIILEFDNVKEDIYASLKRNKVNENVSIYVEELRKNAEIDILLKEDP